MDEALLQDMLIRHEGIRPTAYQDTRGIWTVGVGHNLSVPLTHGAIMQIFKDDLSDAINACVHAFPWFLELTDARQMVMVNLCFNMGLHGLLGFTKMLTAMSLGNYETARTELLNSQWAVQVQPSRRTELANLLWGAEAT